MNSEGIYRNLGSRLFVCLIVLSVLTCLSIQGCASLKITDPTDPNFDETQFRFEDYAEFKKFRTAMEAMFPVGTSKQKIDHVLVDIGGAGMADDGVKMKIARQVGDDERIVRYYKKDNSGIVECMFIIAAVYNKSNILSEEILAYYGCTGP
jgi:hypothetical protein